MYMLCLVVSPLVSLSTSLLLLLLYHLFLTRNNFFRISSGFLLMSQMHTDAAVVKIFDSLQALSLLNFYNFYRGDFQVAQGERRGVCVL